MPFGSISQFLAEVVRFLCGSAFWCALMQLAGATFGPTRTAYVVPRSTFAVTPIHAVASSGEETYVVTFAGSSGERAAYREIAKIGAAGLETPVRIRIPLTPRSTWLPERQSDGFVVTASGWWYATLDDRGADDCTRQCEGRATTFVKSDGSRVTHLRPPVAADQSASWETIVVPGEEPRAIELTYLPEATLAREVEWSGASHTWQLPPVTFEHAGSVVAEPLRDGRIALLSNFDGLSLALLAPDGTVEATPLRNVRVQQFDAAVDDAGRLAIVAARNAIAASPSDTGTIDAAVVDPAHPGGARWSALRHDVRVASRIGDVHVVLTPDGFAAAWIDELHDRRIEAATFDARGHAGTVVDVGSASAQGSPFFGMQGKGDELLFWWDDGEHLFERRLPSSLDGYALVNELAQRFCGKGES